MKTKWSWKLFITFLLAAMGAVSLINLPLFKLGEVVAFISCTAVCLGSFAYYQKKSISMQDYESASMLLGVWVGAFAETVLFLGFVYG